MTMEEMVKEFHQKFDLLVQDYPDSLDEKDYLLRRRLIEEEGSEVIDVMADFFYGDKSATLEDVAKELCDLLYVTIGTAVSYGIPIEKCFAEVHRSNMSKLGGDGKPIRRNDGKVLKGPNYTPANLRNIMYPELDRDKSQLAALGQFYQENKSD